jgi:hypothetical protein
MIQALFQQYGPEYLARFGDRVPEAHRKVIGAICGCRSGSMGQHLFECPDCRQRHVANSSCGNRHCPVCQNEKAARWLDKRLEALLPCSYFMITFTVPEGLRRFLRSHQAVGYEALFKASAGALKRLAADPRFVGCQTAGFFGVLHTWGRTLAYHPHIHYIVPAGGLDKEGSRWLSSKPDFFVHVHPLSRLYRGLFKAAIKEAGMLGQIPERVWAREWVVNSQAVGNGKRSMKYLAPYVFRVAISNNRILAVDNGRVRFRYRKVDGHRWRTMELDVMEFMRRFLQHVLPHGFMKIRHYGFLAARAKVPIEKIRALICVLYELIGKAVPLRKPTHKFKPLSCKHCGTPMRWVMFLPPPASAGGG